MESTIKQHRHGDRSRFSESTTWSGERWQTDLFLLQRLRWPPDWRRNFDDFRVHRGEWSRPPSNARVRWLEKSRKEKVKRTRKTKWRNQSDRSIAREREMRGFSQRRVKERLRIQLLGVWQASGGGGGGGGSGPAWVYLVMTSTSHLRGRHKRKDGGAG